MVVVMATPSSVMSDGAHDRSAEAPAAVTAHARLGALSSDSSVTPGQVGPVVPFQPRGDLLDQVMRWRETDDPLKVLVLTGVGGFGKTRTAMELCRAAALAGWAAGPIDTDEDLRELVRWRGRGRRRSRRQPDPMTSSCAASPC
jgi:hypothetical protein